MSWHAHIWVKWNGKFPKTQNWEWLKEWSEVNAAWSVMGDWDMIIEVNANTPTEVENFIWQKLRSKDWVENTHTTWARDIWKKKAS
jgi:DNA-binding Lrp family transcriptional regulator